MTIDPPTQPAWLYPESLTVAADVQRELAQRVVTEDQLPDIRLIGGVDVSNNLYDPLNQIYAAMVALNAKSLQVMDTATHADTATLPYRPGFLGFREAPVLVKAFEKLETKPDILLVDGHGISHPRGLGIASHLGVLLDTPTVGVAKSILVGHVEGELGEEAGSQAPLVWKGRQIGMALRSKRRSNPLYIASGHRISLPTAIQIVLECLKGYRLPEPTRQAHLAANACRKQQVSLV